VENNVIFKQTKKNKCHQSLKRKTVETFNGNANPLNDTYISINRKRIIVVRKK
jgi:hypothetical protein